MIHTPYNTALSPMPFGWKGDNVKLRRFRVYRQLFVQNVIHNSDPTQRVFHAAHLTASAKQGPNSSGFVLCTLYDSYGTSFNITSLPGVTLTLTPHTTNPHNTICTFHRTHVFTCTVFRPFPILVSIFFLSTNIPRLPHSMFRVQSILWPPLPNHVCCFSTIAWLFRTIGSTTE